MDNWWKAKEKGIAEITGNEAGWERLSLKIDSGAVDTVIPRSTGKAFPVKESEMSRSGQSYRAANGSPITAYGERHLSGVSNDWIPFNIKAQVADVKAPLGSVMHMIRAGNRVVFDSQGSYLLNKRSGQTLPIKEKEGGFEMEFWIQECKSGDIREKAKRKKNQRYAELADSSDDEEEDVTTMDFVRQARP